MLVVTLSVPGTFPQFTLEAIVKLTHRVLPRPYLGALLALTCCALGAPAATDNSIAPLKKVLNSKGYFLGDPATNWPYPGGVMVVLGNTATFNGLPPTVSKPDTQPGVADFMAEKTTRSFSLSALLTGMQAIIGGNPAFDMGHQGSLTFQELHATANKISFSQASALLQNSAVTAQVKSWMNTPNQQVFIIGEAFSTTEVSVSTSSSWNGDIAFNGSAVSKCSSSAPSSTPTSQAASTTGTSAAGDSQTAKKTAPSPVSESATKSGAPVKSDATAAIPGGELHFCTNGTNAITMKTDTPLVFAVGAYKVIRSKSPAGDILDLQPVFTTTKGGTIAEDANARQNLVRATKLAEHIPTTWQNVGWPSK